MINDRNHLLKKEISIAIRKLHRNGNKYPTFNDIYQVVSQSHATYFFISPKVAREAYMLHKKKGRLLVKSPLRKLMYLEIFAYARHFILHHNLSDTDAVNIAIDQKASSYYISKRTLNSLWLKRR